MDGMPCRSGQLIELVSFLLWPAAAAASDPVREKPGRPAADAWCSCSSGRAGHGPLPTASGLMQKASHLLVSTSITQSTPTPALIRICEFLFSSVPRVQAWQASITVASLIQRRMLLRISLLVITATDFAVGD